MFKNIFSISLLITIHYINLVNAMDAIVNRVKNKTTARKMVTVLNPIYRIDNKTHQESPEIVSTTENTESSKQEASSRPSVQRKASKLKIQKYKEVLKQKHNDIPKEQQILFSLLDKKQDVTLSQIKQFVKETADEEKDIYNMLIKSLLEQIVPYKGDFLTSEQDKSEKTEIDRQVSKLKMFIEETKFVLEWDDRQLTGQTVLSFVQEKSHENDQLRWLLFYLQQAKPGDQTLEKYKNEKKKELAIDQNIPKN